MRQERHQGEAAVYPLGDEKGGAFGDVQGWCYSKMVFAQWLSASLQAWQQTIDQRDHIASTF